MLLMLLSVPLFYRLQAFTTNLAQEMEKLNRPVRLHVAKGEAGKTCNAKTSVKKLNMLIVVDCCWMAFAWTITWRSYAVTVGSQAFHGDPNFTLYLVHSCTHQLYTHFRQRRNRSHFIRGPSEGASASPQTPEHLDLQVQGHAKNYAFQAKVLKSFSEIIAFAGKYWWKLDTALPIQLHPPPFPMVDRRADAFTSGLL